MLTVLVDMLFLAKCNVFNQAGRARVHKFIMQMLVGRKPSQTMLMRRKPGLAPVSNPTDSVLLFPLAVAKFLTTAQNAGEIYLTCRIIIKVSPFMK